MAKILIVDDHDVVRQGTRTILQRARPDWTICGEASNGREAIRAVEAFQPDIVILDISMPEMTGIEATPVIAKVAPNCRILLFTMHDSSALAAEAKALGAQGYVQKSQAGRDLVNAVEQLLGGGTFFGPQGTPEFGNPGKAGGQSGHGMASGSRMSGHIPSALLFSGKIDECQKDLPGSLEPRAARTKSMCLKPEYLQIFKCGCRFAYA